MSVDVKELLSKVEDETVRQQLGEQFDSLSGSQLRKERDEAVQENKTLKTEKRHTLYGQAGLPEGAYDVFDSLYDGDLTVESLQDFAKSKGFALPSEEQPETPAGDNGHQPDAQQQRQQGEDRLSQLNAGAIPAREPSIQDRIKKAEADGDLATVDRLNLQLMYDQHAK